MLGRLNFFHAQEPLRSVGLLFSEYLICMQAELVQGLLWVGQPIVVKHVGRVGTVSPTKMALITDIAQGLATLAVPIVAYCNTIW